MAGSGPAREMPGRQRAAAASWAAAAPDAARTAAERLDSVRVSALTETAGSQFSLAARPTDGALPLAGSADAAGLPAPPSAAAQLTASLRTPVGDRDWSQGLGQRLLVMAEQGIDAARLRLNPASLGPLDIQISVEDDRAQVFFGAQHAATREALEAALPRLRELFAAQGMELVQAEVSDRNPDASAQQGGSGPLGSDWPAPVSTAVAGIETGISLGTGPTRGTVDIYV
jgi:flagellar hook-length control protein FliK